MGAASLCDDPRMDWRLEVVVVPVSDVDRAKAFYADGNRWAVQQISRG